MFKPRIMGIVNVTPDSFSGDGHTSTEQAIAQGLRLVREGADILDIGGESTRPDALPLSETEELERVLPVLRGIRAHSAIPLSIDTSKAAVAEASLAAGASLINDVWGGLLDPDIIHVAAKHQCPIVLTHNSRAGHFPACTDEMSPRVFLETIRTELLVLVDNALAHGVLRKNIIVDVGIGFGKTTQQNLLLASNLHFFQTLQMPFLVGTSRKSFIGQVLDVPVAERLEGTLATLVVASLAGVAMVRVHDVLAAKRVIEMALALQNNKI
jgi:dihydropteroate synthase